MKVCLLPAEPVTLKTCFWRIVSRTLPFRRRRSVVSCSCLSIATAAPLLPGHAPHATLSPPLRCSPWFSVAVVPVHRRATSGHHLWSTSSLYRCSKFLLHKSAFHHRAPQHEFECADEIWIHLCHWISIRFVFLSFDMLGFSLCVLWGFSIWKRFSLGFCLTMIILLLTVVTMVALHLHFYFSDWFCLSISRVIGVCWASQESGGIDGGDDIVYLTHDPTATSDDLNPLYSVACLFFMHFHAFSGGSKSTMPFFMIFFWMTLF